WLNDEVLNAGLDWLMQQHAGATTRVRLVNCLLLVGLANMKRRGSYNPRRLSALDLEIRAGEVDVLFVPLHVHGNHWTLLRVDLRAATYAYADSRDAAADPPTETMDVAVWWLTALLPQLHDIPLTGVPPSWDVPVQKDSHSCGIVVLSSLCSLLLGECHWKQDAADKHRMQWFLRLTEGLIDGDEVAEYTDTRSQEDETEDAMDLDGTHSTSLPDAVPAYAGEDLESSLNGETPRAMATLLLDIVDWDTYLGTGDASALHGECPSSPASVPFPGASTTVLHAASNVASSAASPAASSAASSAAPVGLPTSCLGKHPLPIDSSKAAGDEKRTAARRKGKAGAASTLLVQPTSWSYQKDLLARLEQPGFKVDKKKLDTFQRKILADDAHASFDPENPRRLRCSACATWILAPLLFDISSWNTHRRSQKCSRNRSTGLASTSLLAFYQRAPKGSQVVLPALKPSPRLEVPCPGLQHSQDERITRYLVRTSTSGGGAPSRAVLARQLFQSSTRPAEDCTWGDLQHEERRMVLRSEAKRFQWCNLRSVSAVYSTRCDGHVWVADIQVVPEPCPQCLSLLHLALFRTQLNRQMPDEHDMKYTPKLYRNKELGELYLKYLGLRELLEESPRKDGLTPWRKFGIGVAAGKYKDSRVMLGAIEAMQMKHERVAQGKRLQNMKYSREFTDFANVLASISTRAYQTFRHHFGGPHVRTLQKLRARLPRFQPGLSPTNITLAAAVLKKLDYCGPTVLAWDDTALEAAISVWEDAATKTCSIIGSTYGVIDVASAEEFDELFRKAKESKATKIRLYVLVVPLAKVPPLLLAAVARGGKENAQELFNIHTKLLEHLHALGIHPVTHAADGTEVERVLQRKIIASSDRFLHYDIPNDTPGCSINLQIGLANGHPVVVVQDPKHALKTARNQLFTGARILVLGCLAFFYAQLLALAEHVLSPLFRRDVEKVDKHDDRAAARLFSAESLNITLRYHSELRALATYLFVLGELVDAWENRVISHVERARMVMCARYFLMAWRTHVVLHPSYSTNVQFISRESFDIFITLCDSLLSLIIVYRRYFPHHPFMPWLHSTAPCEHIFGIIRTLKKDFNFADLLYLEPKLRTLLLGAFDRLTPLDRANDTAGGYYHSYFDSTDVNADNLRQWPSDTELQEASRAAFQDAEQLLESLQLNARKLLQQYKAPGPSATDQASLGRQRAPAGSIGTPTPRGPQTLAELLELYARVDLDPVQEQEAAACEIALVAESMDGTLAINALPDACDATELPAVKAVIDQQTATTTGKYCLAKSALSARTSARDIMTTATTPSIKCMDEPLYDSAVRQYQQPHKNSHIAQPMDGRDESSLTLRQQLLQRLACLVPEDGTFNATSGVDRHKKTLRRVTATNHCRLRSDALLVLQDIHENFMTANVSSIHPLISGAFIVVLDHTTSLEPRVLLGRILTMYSKSDARGSRHEHVTEVDNVGILSYVAVEVFVFSHNSTYSSLACPQLGTSTILRFPPTQVLFSFVSCKNTIKLAEITTPDGSTLTLATLCDYSAAILDQLQDRRHEVACAVKGLSKLVKKNKQAPQVAVDEEQGGSSSDDADGI
ncbi:hypothetical protein C2E23DRAFT_737305, partial [Lenzites betulinus]